MQIPLAKPEILQSDIDSVAAVMRSLRLSQGPLLRAFEEALAAYLNASYVVALNSGTSALQLALRAMNIGKGDEVILPSFSFMAVTNAVLAVGAVPVFADIDANRWNISATTVEPLLSCRTKAIIVVHTFGHPAEMDNLIYLARKHGILLIEDACEGIGAELNGRKVGTLGDVGIFAFYPNKQITTGEGGALATNSFVIADSVRRLSNQGRDSSACWLQHSNIGFSYRLSDINCALGLEQLSRIKSILRRREELAHSYEFHLSGINGLEGPTKYLNGRISWFTYPVVLPVAFHRGDRDEIWRDLMQVGIESGRYFPPAHLQPVLRHINFRCGDLTETLSVSQRTLCLPFFHTLEQSEITFICESLHHILTRNTLYQDDTHVLQPNGD